MLKRVAFGLVYKLSFVAIFLRLLTFCKLVEIE
nr:MAG TPA: hypothetical protein [Caudoviricetes sp.]